MYPQVAVHIYIQPARVYCLRVSVTGIRACVYYSLGEGGLEDSHEFSLGHRKIGRFNAHLGGTFTCIDVVVKSCVSCILVVASACGASADLFRVRIPIGTKLG